MLAAVSVVAVIGASVGSTPMAHAAGTLTTSNYRESGGDIVQNSAYDYAPTIMQDGRYRMWWCGASQGPGDNILYAESNSLNGPFHAPGSSAPYQVVFKGTNDGTSFDYKHTCDPSVIRVNSTYFMYYGGAQEGITGIGVAQSSDGINWTRLNGGKPIVVAANKKNVSAGSYGAGQPSVVFVGGYYYMLYTDTTGAASPTGSGNAQYVLRSTDATFQTGVQELTSTGFATKTASNHTAYAFLSGPASVDWSFSDALNSFVVAVDGPSDGTTLTFYGTGLKSQTYTSVVIPHTVAEGPGIVTAPNRHMPPPPNGACGTVPADVVHATTLGPTPDNLQHFGLDLNSGLTCASMASRVGALYDGYALEVNGYPLTLDVSGQRLQSGTAPPIQDLTQNFIVSTPEVFNDIPYGATLQSGATVLGATGRPPAFLLDNKLWVVNSFQPITDNGSDTTYVTPAQWDSYGRGPDLFVQN